MTLKKPAMPPAENPMQPSATPWRAERRVPEARRNAEPAPNRRLAILIAAEKLFGLHGYQAVSIRDIAKEAGVPLALVGYYWGAKHELYRSIIESWQGSIDLRLQGLNAAMADAEADDALERLLDSFVTPLVAMHGDPEGQYYAMMAARDLAAPMAEAEAAQREFFDPMAHRYIDALKTLFPQRSRGDVAWCYQFTLGAVLHFLTDQRVERLSHGENKPADPAQKDRLLRFVAAGCRALLAAAPAARKRR